MRRRGWLGWLLVVVQLALLAALVVLPRGAAWPMPSGLQLVLRGLQLAGLVLAGWGLLGLGRSLSAHPAPVSGGDLRTGGPYRFVRHPVYAGLLLWGLATAVVGRSWVLVALWLLLLALFEGKAHWEESMLRASYPGYQDYQARTGRFLPRLRPG